MERLGAYDDLTAVLPTDGDVRLRPWRVDDVDAVLAACQDPRTARFVPAFPAPYQRQHAQAYVLGAAAHWEARRHLRLAVCDAAGLVLGSADLDDLHPDAGYGEAGWWVAPDARGRGLGGRAARMLVRDVGHGLLGLHRVEARILAANSSSRWVAASAGLHLEATERGRLCGEDQEVWRLLADEDPLAAQPELDAGVCALRAILPADAPAVLAACQDPEMRRWMPLPSPYTIEHAEKFCGRDGVTAWATRHGSIFAAVDPTDGRLLASLEIHRSMGVSGVLGFWTVREERRRGVATTALRALTRYAFAPAPDGLGVLRLEWEARAGNNASRRVAQKLGFGYEGSAEGGCRRPTAPGPTAGAPRCCPPTPSPEHPASRRLHQPRERCHVRTDVVQSPQRGEDLPVVDVGIAVHQDVAEADGAGDLLGPAGVEHTVASQGAHGVGVGARRPPSLAREHVVGGIHAALDHGHEEVLDVAESRRVRGDLAGLHRRVSAQHRQVVADAPQHPSQALLIDHAPPPADRRRSPAAPAPPVAARRGRRGA